MEKSRIIFFILMFFVIGFLGLFSSLEMNYSEINLKYNLSYINITDDNLTLHLSFDVQENFSLNITGDSSGFFNNGTLGSATGTQPIWNSEGYIGGAYLFDGTNDYINVDNDFILDYPFTFSGFFKSNPTGGTLISIGDSSDSSIYYVASISSGTGYFTMIVRNDSTQHIVASIQSYNDGSWHSFSAIFKNESYREAYVDGVSVINDSYESSFLASDKVYIGARVRNTKDVFFNGTLDEIMVFNRVLNISEIKEIVFGDFIENPLDFNVSVHTRSLYKKSFDSIDFNFSIEHRIISDPNDPINHDNLTFISQYSYDGVTWYNISNAFYISSFNISEWSGCFGDSLTSYTGRWPPVVDGLANTNLSLSSGSYLQLGNPGWSCDEILQYTLPGNLTNNTIAFVECGANDVNDNYYTDKLSESENVAEIMEDYREIVALAQEHNVTIHFINIVAGDYTNLTGNVSEIDEDDLARINVIKEINRQSYDYYINNEYNGTIISYSDVWTPLVDPSNNLSVLPAYGTELSYHPSDEGNLVYAHAVWSDNYKHKKNGEYHASFYPQYPTQVRFHFNVTSVKGNSGYYETDYYNLNFYDDESACSSAGRYWYSGTCNANPQQTSSNSQETNTGGSTGAGTLRPSQKSLENGYKVNVVKNRKVEIPFGDEKESVEVKSVSEDRVVVSVNGEDYEVLLDGEGKIDLDKDGIYDLKISNSKIYNSIATLEFEFISEEVSSDVQDEESENIIGDVINDIPEAVKNLDWKFYVLVGIVLVLVVLYFGVFRKKRK